MINILIVDDDELFAEMLQKRLLRELQPEHELAIHLAPSVEEAELIIAKATLDVVLTDNKLGTGKSGLAWLEELHKSRPGIDSILFTGLDEEVGLRTAEIGVYRYIIKPFEPAELVWTIKALLQRRTSSYERNWLTTLNQVGTKLQQALTTEEVAKVLVTGGVQLGFERARLYRVSQHQDGEVMFQGLCQAGTPLINEFQTLTMFHSQSSYASRVYDARTLVFFDALEHGPGFQTRHLKVAGAPSAVGEWVGLPIVINTQCRAIMMMDNPLQPKLLRQEERTLLNLFAQHASAAWERAMNAEQRRLEERAMKIARRIIERTSKDGEPDDFEKLVKILYRSLKRITPTTNFAIALKHYDREIDAEGWLRYVIHIYDGEPQPPYWRAPNEEKRFNRYFIDHEKEPYYFTHGTLAYRKERGIPEPKRKAESVIAVPLIVGQETTGCVFVEDFDHSERWSQDCFKLCCAVLGHLAPYIQTARISHERKQQNDQLQLLRMASEKLMTLAQQQPANLPEAEWLWHATLTLATAEYGFCFNRAFFFTLEEGGNSFYGRMGIGDLALEVAEKSWEQDKANGLTTFDRYLEQLVAGDLVTVTPADPLVRKLKFAASASSAFAKIVATKKVVSIPKLDAQEMLPTEFIAHFNPHDYWLIPANAGDRLIGVMVLDTFCGTEPPQTFALKYLDALTNEAALIYENLRRSRAQQQLLAVTRETLNYAATTYLTVTLQKIAATTHLVTDADSVAIYPLRANTSLPQFDEDSIVWYSNTTQLVPNRQTQPTPLMDYVFDYRRPLPVEDVEQLVNREIRFADDPVVQATGIKAFIVVPIYGQRTGSLRGLLYINYRWKRPFSEDDMQLAQGFANLTAIALRSWREHHGLRIEKESREEELRILMRILERALEPDVDERALINTLLRQTRAFLSAHDLKAAVSIALFLRTWERRNGGEPFETRRQYYLSSKGVFERSDLETLSGLTGLAMRTGKTSSVGDVSQHELYRERSDGIQTDYPNRKTQSELDVPILDENGLTIGVFNIESSEKYYFTAVHEQMLIRLSHIAMLALDSVRRRQFTDSIFAAGQAITAPTSLTATLKVIVEQVKSLLPDLSLLTIWYHNPEQNDLILAAHTGLKDESKQEHDRPRNTGAVMKVMQSHEPIWADDVNTNQVFKSSDFVEREEIRSTAAFPLVFEDQSIGAIFFAYRNPHRFTRVEREMLPILVQFVAIGIHDAQAILSVEKEKRRLKAALDVTEAVSTTPDYAQLVTSARHVLTQLYQDVTILILIYNRKNNCLEIVDDPSHPYHIDHADYIGKRVVEMDAPSMIVSLARASQESKKQETHLIPNISERGNQPYLHLRSRAQTAIGATFVDSNGELLGGLIMEGDVPNLFDRSDVELGAAIATQIGLAIDRSHHIAAIDFRNIVTDSMMWAADLAHDLNRETYHIRSWLQSLQEEQNLSDDGKDAIKQIEASFDAIVRDAPWAKQEHTDIENLAQQIADWTREFVGQHPITLEISSDTVPIAVNTISQILKRTVRYLTRNALKAMDYSGSIVIQTHYLDKSTVCIKFKDSGPGVKNDDPLRARMWHERLDDRGKGGLGLLFTRLHVEKLNGHIHLLAYEEGSGANFCIHLPLK